LSKDAYAHEYTKIARALAPDMDMATITSSCLEDWASDRRIVTGDRPAGDGLNECLTKQQFASSIFELADLWCLSLDINEYESFIRMLDDWNGMEYKGEISATQGLMSASYHAEDAEVRHNYSQHHGREHRRNTNASNQTEESAKEKERVMEERASEARERDLMKREETVTVIHEQQVLYDRHVKAYNSSSTLTKAAWSVRKIVMQANSPRSTAGKKRIRRNNGGSQSMSSRSPSLAGVSVTSSPKASGWGGSPIVSAMDMLTQKLQHGRRMSAAVMMPLVPELGEEPPFALDPPFSPPSSPTPSPP